MQLHPMAERPQHMPRHLSRLSNPESQLLGSRSGRLGIWCLRAARDLAQDDGRGEGGFDYGVYTLCLGPAL